MNDDTALPPGKTCLDCSRMPTCEWLINREGSETVCDWSPSKFVEVPIVVKSAEQKTTAVTKAQSTLFDDTPKRKGAY